MVGVVGVLVVVVVVVVVVAVVTVNVGRQRRKVLPVPRRRLLFGVHCRLLLSNTTTENLVLFQISRNQV